MVILIKNIFVMKRLLLILILTFSFQTLTKADDIRDFEIEGMSIGDSLLNYINKNDIKDQKLNYFTDKRKYYVIGIFDDLKFFDQVEIYLKSNDKDYQIKTITGMIKIENLKACLSKKKEIIEDINVLFLNTVKDTAVKSNEFDKTGKSKQYVDQYVFDMDNHIRVECMQWSEKMKNKNGFTNTLNLVVMTDEISRWINRGYK